MKMFRLILFFIGVAIFVTLSFPTVFVLEIKKVNLEMFAFACIFGSMLVGVVRPAVLVALLAFALGLQSANAQTNTNDGTITPSQAADIIVAGIEQSASNWVLSVDGLYAPSAESDGQFGAAVLLGYKVSDYVIIGVHGEYLNNLPTYGGGQLTLQLPLHPLAGLVGKLPKWATSATATPWAFVGSGTSFGNGKAVTVVGEAATGLAVGLWRSPHGTYAVGLNAGIGKRTDLSGEVYIGGIDGQVNF